MSRSWLWIVGLVSAVGSTGCVSSLLTASLRAPTPEASERPSPAASGAVDGPSRANKVAPRNSLAGRTAAGTNSEASRSLPPGQPQAAENSEFDRLLNSIDQHLPWQKAFLLARLQQDVDQSKGKFSRGPVNPERRSPDAAATVSPARETSEPTVRPPAPTPSAVSTPAGQMLRPPLADTANASPAQEPPPPSPPVVPKELTAVEKGTVEKGEWRQQLSETLSTLQREIAQHPPADREREQLAVMQRMLQLLANQRDQAVAEIKELNEDEREYWKHQVHALLVTLDAEGKHASSRRAALALRELRAAADHLTNLSALDVRNLAFCEKVESFGRYTPFKTTSFKPGQELLLYVEIDNFSVKQVGDKYETEIQAEYNLVDANGHRVSSKLATVKEESRNRRHDYFVAYHVNLPKDLAPGPYTLQLILEDVKGQKSSQASLDFKIR